MHAAEEYGILLVQWLKSVVWLCSSERWNTEEVGQNAGASSS